MDGDVVVVEGGEFVCDDGVELEFFVELVGYGGGESVEVVRGDGDGSGEDVFEFEEWFFVVDDVVEWVGGL